MWLNCTSFSLAHIIWTHLTATNHPGWPDQGHQHCTSLDGHFAAVGNLKLSSISWPNFVWGCLEHESEHEDLKWNRAMAMCFRSQGAELPMSMSSGGQRENLEKNRYWCTVEIICFFSYVSKNPSALAEPSGWRWQKQKHRDPSPSHFNCFMWSSVASARGNGVSPAPDLLRSRALRLSPRCAFGPPLPPAGDQQPEEFLDAAAYVRLGTSNTCSSFLLDSDYSDCFRFSLSLWFWIECMDSVFSCFFGVFFVVSTTRRHEWTWSQCVQRSARSDPWCYRRAWTDRSTWFFFHSCRCSMVFYMYGNMSICMIHSCFHSSIFSSVCVSPFWIFWLDVVQNKELDPVRYSWI